MMIDLQSELQAAEGRLSVLHLRISNGSASLVIGWSIASDWVASSASSMRERMVKAFMFPATGNRTSCCRSMRMGRWLICAPFAPAIRCAGCCVPGRVGHSASRTA